MRAGEEAYEKAQQGKEYAGEKAKGGKVYAGDKVKKGGEKMKTDL